MSTERLFEGPPLTRVDDARFEATVTAVERRAEGVALELDRSLFYPTGGGQPCDLGTLDGLIAAVPGDDWATLDLREAAYRRHPLSHDRLTAAPHWAQRIEIYAVDEAHGLPPGAQPILLSYLDTVVQGFLREFGPTGVEGFFATTAGWCALLDDRAAPHYPRSQPTTAAERRLVDDHAEALGLTRLMP